MYRGTVNRATAFAIRSLSSSSFCAHTPQLRSSPPLVILPLRVRSTALLFAPSRCHVSAHTRHCFGLRSLSSSPLCARSTASLFATSRRPHSARTLRSFTLRSLSSSSLCAHTPQLRSSLPLPFLPPRTHSIASLFAPSPPPPPARRSPGKGDTLRCAGWAACRWGREVSPPARLRRASRRAPRREVRPSAIETPERKRCKNTRTCRSIWTKVAARSSRRREHSGRNAHILVHGTERAG